MDDGDILAPGNGRRVQVRKVREGGFTEAKKRIFLDHLAACCNVTRAAAAAGVSVETTNYHKRRDPIFAAQRAEAIETGYEALECATMERAMRGGRYEPGGTIVPAAETVDTALALHLLSLRHKAAGRRTGDGGPRVRRVSEAELTRSILEKLAAARKSASRPRSGRAGRGKGASRLRSK